jgi:hypothetical protein
MNLMARSVVWVIVKWLVVPAALTALGYFVVGPKIGATLKNQIPAAKPASTEPVSENSADAATTAAFPAPEVEVKVGSTAPRKRSSHRRRHRTSTRRTNPPPVEAPKEAAGPPPPVDEGGSGGAVGGDGAAGVPSNPDGE